MFQFELSLSMDEAKIVRATLAVKAREVSEPILKSAMEKAVAQLDSQIYPPSSLELANKHTLHPGMCDLGNPVCKAYQEIKAANPGFVPIEDVEEEAGALDHTSGNWSVLYRDFPR